MSKSKNQIDKSKIKAGNDINIGDKKTSTKNITNIINLSSIPLLIFVIIGSILLFQKEVDPLPVENKDLSSIPDTTNTLNQQEGTSDKTSSLPNTSLKDIEKHKSLIIPGGAEKTTEKLIIAGYVKAADTMASPISEIKISSGGKSTIADAEGYFYLELNISTNTKEANLTYSGKGYHPLNITHYGLPRKDIIVHLQPI